MTWRLAHYCSCMKMLVKALNVRKELTNPAHSNKPIRLNYYLSMTKSYHGNHIFINYFLLVVSTQVAEAKINQDPRCYVTMFVVYSLCNWINNSIFWLRSGESCLRMIHKLFKPSDSLISAKNKCLPAKHGSKYDQIRALFVRDLIVKTLSMKKLIDNLNKTRAFGWNHSALNNQLPTMVF